jgi:hypothetical protein
VPPDSIHALGADLGVALDVFSEAIPRGGSGYVLPTYSAMLEVRQTLAQRHRHPAFWNE